MNSSLGFLVLWGLGLASNKCGLGQASFSWPRVLVDLLKPSDLLRCDDPQKKQ